MRSIYAARMTSTFDPPQVLTERAILLATNAHAGQLDKNGQAYILHPLRVMGRFWTPEERQAAVLHDVVEDTNQTLHSLESYGFSDTVIQTVGILTQVKGSETRREYEDRILNCGHPMPLKVKLADVTDNLHPLRRGPNISASLINEYMEFRMRLVTRLSLEFYIDLNWT